MNNDSPTKFWTDIWTDIFEDIIFKKIYVVLSKGEDDREECAENNEPNPDDNEYAVEYFRQAGTGIVIAFEGSVGFIELFISKMPSSSTSSSFVGRLLLRWE